jgi:type I restriction enzyme M protein
LIDSVRSIMRKDKGLSGELDRIPALTWVLFLKFLDDWEAIREEEGILAGREWHSVCESPYRWRDWASMDDGITGPQLLAFVNQDEAVRPDGSHGPGLFAYLRSLGGEGASSRRKVVANAFAGLNNRMINGYLLRDVINLVDEIRFTSTGELSALGHIYESLLREMRDAAGDSGEFYTPRPVVEFMVDIVNPRIGETVLDPATGTAGFLVEAYRHMAPSARTVEDHEWLQTEALRGGEPKPLPYLLAEMNLLLHGVEAPNIDAGNSLRTPLREIGEKERVDLILTNPPFGGEEEPGIRLNFPRDLQTSETALLFLQLIMRKLRREPPGRAAVVVPNTTLFYGGVAARIRRMLLSEFNLHSIVRLPKGVFEPYTDIETNLLFFSAEGSTEDILFYRLEPPEERKQYTKTRPLKPEELAEVGRLIDERSADSPNAWMVSAAEVLDEELCNLDRHNPKNVQDASEPPGKVIERIHSTLEESSVSLGRARGAVDLLADLTNAHADWTELELGSVLQRRRDVVVIEDDQMYKRLRIRVKGRGVELRDEKLGAEIGTKRQFLVEAGQFVLSKIDARNGAFGIVPEECDKAIITGNFWAYEVDAEALSPVLLKYLTQSDAFLYFCSISSPGATNRRYLQEEQFLAQRAVVPRGVEDQEALREGLDALSAVTQTGEATLGQLGKQFPILLQSALHQVFGAPAGPKS